MRIVSQGWWEACPNFACGVAAGGGVEAGRPVNITADGGGVRTGEWRGLSVFGGVLSETSSFWRWT